MIGTIFKPIEFVINYIIEKRNPLNHEYHWVARDKNGEVFPYIQKMKRKDKKKLRKLEFESCKLFTNVKENDVYGNQLRSKIYECLSTKNKDLTDIFLLEAVIVQNYNAYTNKVKRELTIPSSMTKKGLEAKTIIVHDMMFDYTFKDKDDYKNAVKHYDEIINEKITKVRNKFYKTVEVTLD